MFLHEKVINKIAKKSGWINEVSNLDGSGGGLGEPMSSFFLLPIQPWKRAGLNNFLYCIAFCGDDSLIFSLTDNPCCF